MARYIVLNGKYAEDLQRFVVTALDMIDAIDIVKKYLESLDIEDRPYDINPIAIGIFDESAIIVKLP